MFMNHFEFTIAPETLTDEWCRDVDQLLVDILGWGAGKTHRFPHEVTGEPVVARFYQINKDQFGVLNEHRNYLASGHDDHVGFHIESREKLLEILTKIKALAQKDDRVQFMNLPNGEFATISEDDTITGGFYVKYLLPIFLDLQTKWKSKA
jgi:hypothetical protein